jgi:molybdopterin molybdotransferase
VRDQPEALRHTLQQAAMQADAILTSGGVSAGDADHVREVLATMGEVAFWKVAMRPGRPFAFGLLHREAQHPGREGTAPPCALFALPGNPVAALVTFYALARSALLQLAGANAEAVPLVQARCLRALRKRPGRTEYQRARVSQGRHPLQHEPGQRLGGARPRTRLGGGGRAGGCAAV